MSYNVGNFEQTIYSDGVQGTVQVSDGNLGLLGANGVTISSLGDITANAFFGYTTGGGGGGGATPSLQAVTAVGATTDREITINNDLNVSGNLYVSGDLVSVDTENLVVQDPIIQLANNSPSDTADAGIVFTRPTSNVVIGWRGDEDEVMLGFSTSSAAGTDLTPLDDDKLNLKVYGNVEATNFVKGDATHMTNITDASAGTYGSSTKTSVITVDSSGRVSGISQTNINFPDETSNLHNVVDRDNETTLNIRVGKVITSKENGIVGDGELVSNTVNSDVGPATYGNTTHIAQITVNSLHRISAISNVEIQERSNLDQVVNRSNITTNVLQVGGLYSSGNVETLEYFLGNANLLSNIVNSDVTPGTYGSGTQVPQIVIDSDHRITSITTVPNTGGDVGTLQDVTDTGNTTSNTIQFSNTNVSLVAAGNVEVQGLYLGNANLLSNIVNSDVGPATYGNATHVTQITITDTGRISGVSNVEIQERSNLDQVVNRGNVTSNTVEFTNPTTALVTDLTSNVEIKLNQLANVSIDSLSAEQGLLYDGSNWVNDYSVRNFTKIINKTGDTLYQGNTVYIVDGYQNNANVANVALADATDPAKMPAIGMLFEDVPPDGESVAVTYGKVQNVDVDGFLEGETVYVSNTIVGGISNVKPTINGELIQNVGIVVKTGANGVVFVTGVGRTNDIPNGTVTTDRADMLYVYGETAASRFAKITPQNFRSNLDQIVNTGNVTSNTLLLTDVQVSGKILASTGTRIYSDGADPISIGNTLAMDTQGQYAIAIGTQAGETSQTSYGIAIGYQAGQTNQLGGTLAIGNSAGNQGQQLRSISLGFKAGYVDQDQYSIAVGAFAGETDQEKSAIAIGWTAGQTTQGESSVAIGNNAANSLQGDYSVAIGRDAGRSSQDNAAIGIGRLAGETSQGFRAVAIGLQAGQTSQGNHSVALGPRAGETNQHANTIVINAQVNTPLNTTQPNAIFVKPVRVSTGATSNLLGYTTEGEIIDRGVLHSNLDQIVNTGNVTSNSITVGGLVSTGQANVSDILVSQAVGAIPTVSANIITVDQAGHTYKFFRIPAYPTGSLEGITIQNTTDGCQTIVDIHPIGGDLDVFEDFSNGGSGPTVLTSLNSNLVINTGNHVMISCVTDLSNTFVNIIGFY